MKTVTPPANLSAAYCPLVPAVPTDTSTVMTHLLALSEHARREQKSSVESGIIPRNILMMLLRTMKLRDPSIVGHSQRIATISSGLAGLLGWDDAQRRTLEVAALLHDLGKIGVPEHILRKPGKLSSDEYDFVTQHHQASVSLLQALGASVDLILVLTHLHSNFDAAGVEKDESGVSFEPPLGSRILAVADAYDTLSTPKAYRRGMTHEEVMKVLEDHSGTRYDGNIVRAMKHWYESEGHVLFRQLEPFCDYTPLELSQKQHNEIVVLTQLLQVLYQFQRLYDGYFVVDADGRYCVWSEGMPGLTGLHTEYALGRDWHASDVRLLSIAQPDSREVEPSAEIISQVMRHGRAHFGSRICQVSDSQQLSIDIHTMPIGRPSAGTCGAVQLFRCKGGVRRHTREYSELRLAATRDALTGVANRGQLETQLRHLIDDFHNHEGGRHLSMVFLDVDRFKGINDTYGHKAGDQVLVDLTRLLQNETYSGEVIGRYGGEEFVLLCPDTDLSAAVRRAERLRHAIAKSSIGGITSLSVTSSFGVATARLGDSVQTLLERADTCLYRAKETGRNRTCWEDQEHDECCEPIVPVQESVSGVSIEDGILLYSETIDVSTSLELTAIKLNAFLTASDIKVLAQDRGFLRLQSGRAGFSRRWGDTPERQPVSIEVHFESQRRTNPVSGHHKTIHFVSVTMQPVGRQPDVDVFEARCSRLIQDLRAYLLSS